MKILTRKRVTVYGLGVLAVVVALYLGKRAMLDMPGQSYRGPLPALTPAQTALRDALRQDVEMLATTIGERHVFRPHYLDLTVKFLEKSLHDAGHTVQRQEYPCNGRTVSNLEVEVSGTKAPGQIVVVGAHFDSVIGSPGANDNATGTAAVLAFARSWAQRQPERTLRLVLFVNEEPPFFQNPNMGSWVYAKRCRERNQNIVAMIALDGIGYFSDRPGSQEYPPPFNLAYPSTANFIGFVGNWASRDLVRRAVGTFRAQAAFPSEGGALPDAAGAVGLSDHWSFWQEGYPALLVTDTLPFRYPHYHRETDVPDQVDFDRMTRVVEGVDQVMAELVKAE